MNIAHQPIRRPRDREGVVHELRVAALLIEYGWNVSHFGLQALAPAVWDDVIRGADTLRYWPDFVATHAGTVRFVDAKKCIPRVGYAINEAELAAQQAFGAGLGVPVWLAFGDMCTVTADVAHTHATTGPRRHNGTGSGLPYVLLDPSFALPFAEVWDRR